MIYFGRDICNDERQATQREWLVTNGIGGYASGTVAGTLTRRYHGYLVAALKPPLGRTLLLTKLDENATYDDQSMPLFSNLWKDAFIEPYGFRAIEQFRLEGTTPVWTFACADALLEKRLWMEQGANTTYILYTMRRGSAPITLDIRALVNYRDHHSGTYAADWQMRLLPGPQDMRIEAFLGATPFFLVSDRATLDPDHTWYRNFWLSQEKERGLNCYDDNLCVGTFSAVLQPGESFTIVATTDPNPMCEGTNAYERHYHAEQEILYRERQEPCTPAWVCQLNLAANQFIVQRPTEHDSDGSTIIAGYHWFSDWGRDTMTSLHGLTITTGRYDVARRILYTFARYVDQGMLPNRFPDDGAAPEYNTIDAALWYIEATRAYVTATDDIATLEHLFPTFEEIITWYLNGTRYQIHVDPTDGLVFGGERGMQLTWMDAKIGDWVVTPRIGKPVEVNALWYNALRSVASFARLLGMSPERYDEAANQTRAGFARFWNAEAGYCYDVLDGPEGHDDALRPNQLLAVSLPHSPLEADQQGAVVDMCARTLLTSYGLRSLSPDDPDYIGTYTGDPLQRDRAYHQGTIWSWLIGPFVMAHLRVYHDPTVAQSFLIPLAHSITAYGIGSISEIFDGDSPFIPRGCIAQSWGVAELLRAWHATIDSPGTDRPEKAIPR